MQPDEQFDELKQYISQLALTDALTEVHHVLGQIAPTPEPEDMVYGGDLTKPFLVPGLAGQQFITPRGGVVECLSDDGTELQCRYIKRLPGGHGNSVDFTRSVVLKLLILI